jgi:hypothetical protein
VIFSFHGVAARNASSPRAILEIRHIHAGLVYILVKNDVELRATEDRICEYCYSKNEEALGALTAFSVSDDMHLSPDTPSNRVANTENADNAASASASTLTDVKNEVLYFIQKPLPCTDTRQYCEHLCRFLHLS